MPRLTITNLLTSDIQLQEPTGNYAFSVTIPGGETKVYDVATGLAENLEPVLQSLVTLGRVTWTATQNPASKLETSTQAAAPLVFSQSTRPAANAVGATPSKRVFGTNTTTGQEEYSDGTNWYDTDGNKT